MTNTETKTSIQEFQALDLESQKKKLKAMVTVFAHTAPVWQEVLEAIETNDAVDKEFTESIYVSIMEYAEEVEQGNKAKAMEAAQRATSYLESIRKKEAEEKQQETQELESMLDQIENS